MNRVMLATTCVLALLALTGGSRVWAGVQFSPLVESENSFTFTLEGDDFGILNKTSVSSTLNLTGKYWSLADITLIADEILGDDVLSFSGKFQHMSGPHVDDALGLPISFSVTAKGSDLVLPTPQWPAGNTAQHPNGHLNVGAIETVIKKESGLTNDITGWKFTLTGQHLVPPPPEDGDDVVPPPDPVVVPEPTTLGIWSLLGAVGIGFSRWRRRR